MIELGLDKTYVLYDEIHEMLPEEVISISEELEEVYNRLHVLGVPVISRPERYQNREDDASPTGDFDKKDEDSQEYVLTEQEKTNDPVRMYLREMGTVPLLDREGEVEIAQRIENGEWMIYEALCSNQVVLRELLRLNELAQKDKKILRELVTSEADDALDAKAQERIQKNLDTFQRISEQDSEIRSLREQQKGLGGDDPKRSEIEREVDRLMAKISKDIRSIDFSVQTRNQLVELLRDIHREFSRLKNDVRRAKRSLEREKNAELRALQERRIEKYQAKLEELEKRYALRTRRSPRRSARSAAVRLNASAPRNS
ncbi:MAG: hypothetical protein MI919_04800 [Holophagales bacterium]|nr:hypothetical protein [Holophagales bacterium]